MISPHKLRAWRCVGDVVRVVDEVGVKSAARAPVYLDMPMAALLLLWTILRDERRFLLICLEEMGVDMWGLTRDVDSLIDQKNAAGRDAGLPAHGMRSARSAVDPFVAAWLDRAGREAGILGHHYLGVEHLLLAVVAEPDAPLKAVLLHHGLDHARLCDAIVAALARTPFSEVLDILDTFKPFGTGWDTPATGVPRRYSMAMILGMMAVYAVLFAALRLLGAIPEVFLVVSVLFTGVALGQPLLYGGRYPRAASIWIGAVLFPVEFLAIVLYANIFRGSDVPVAGAICWLIVCIPLGALFGYLAGCLAAGMFCVLDWYEKRKQSRSPPAEPATFDPFEKPE